MKEQALLALQGPKAVEVLARLAPGVEQLGFMTGGAFDLGGAPAWISRSGYTGEDGFEISVPADRAEALAELLAGEPEVKPIGLGARDSLRLEAGLPLYGHDLDPRRRRSRPTSASPSPSGAEPRAASPAGRGSCARSRKGRSAAASDCPSRAASRSARARRSSIPTATRSAR